MFGYSKLNIGSDWLHANIINYGYEGVKVTLAAAELPDAAQEDASSQHPGPSCSGGGQPPVTPR